MSAIRETSSQEHNAMSDIFVFGSNKSGIHGAGSALEAKRFYGAVDGIGEGQRGTSYAIPTKNFDVYSTLSLSDIQKHVKTFLAHATDCPDDLFHVTRIGCGFAGYNESDIIPLFKDAPRNVILPPSWREANGELKNSSPWKAVPLDEQALCRNCAILFTDRNTGLCEGCREWFGTES